MLFLKTIINTLIMRATILFFSLLFACNWLLFAQNPAFIDNTEKIATADRKAYHPDLFSQKTKSENNIDVTYTRFDWVINPEVLYISGNVNMIFKTREATATEVKLELNQTMTIDSIIHKGEKTTWAYLNSFQFSIQLTETIPPSSIDSLHIYYRGVPEEGTGFGSFIQNYHDDTPIIWTLSEPYGAKEWWPGKNDLTDKIDSIDVIVTTPTNYRAASHGILVSETATGDNIRYHWKHRYPIVSYLVAVAVTNYAVFTNYAVLNGDSLPILEYVYPEDSAMIASQTANTPEMLHLFDTLFAPYPFASEKYGHAQFGRGGGMEHQTMSFMANYSHDIRAHELAHSWYGNKITLASWHDIFLNEGFATYATGLSYENMYNGFYWNIWKTNTRNAIIAEPDGSVYVEDTTDVARIFNARLSYHKGAYILHMLRWIMGDKDFFTALHNYTSDPNLAFSFATFEDFRNHFEHIAGKDFTDFFDSWYYGEGYPIYSIELAQSENGNVAVTIHQEQSHPSVSFFQMPVPVTLYGNGMQKEVICNHSFSGETFIIDNPGFTLDSAKFDEHQWIAAKLNTLNLSVDSKALQSRLTIQPNPAIDRIEIIQPTNKLIAEVEVYMASNGRRISLQVEKIQNKAILNISSLKTGIYIVNCFADDGSFTSGKFVKTVN
jgi:aminopeptidase N